MWLESDVMTPFPLTRGSQGVMCWSALSLWSGMGVRVRVRTGLCLDTPAHKRCGEEAKSKEWSPVSAPPPRRLRSKVLPNIRLRRPTNTSEALSFPTSLTHHSVRISSLEALDPEVWDL